ncbi:MAG: UxaA family hydrolase, partial [Sphingopyxis sp.]
MTQYLFHIHPEDSVAVALADCPAGLAVAICGRTITLRQSVARGHKCALVDHQPGDVVRKYGQPIGAASAPIAAGDWVHSHNLATRLATDQAVKWTPDSAPAITIAPATPHADNGAADSVDGVAAPATGHAAGPTWLGYDRGDGTAGTRNEIWIFPTVGCVARTAQRIAQMASALYCPANGGVGGGADAGAHGGAGTGAGAAHGGAGAGAGTDGGAAQIDGIHAFTHPHGCSQLSEDLDGTRAILASLAAHPNAGGVVIIGLGCESNQMAALLAAVPPAAHARIRTVIAQDLADEVQAGMAAVAELVALAGQHRRTPLPLSRLTIGLKCGGSDGFSGLTANPLLGRLSETIVSAGGRAILTEIPEIFGAEQLLLQRAQTRQTFDDGMELIADFKEYFRKNGEPVSENPSPGNIAGGITTLEEKSLGAVQKAGRCPITAVARYGGRAGDAGVTLLEAPGNDAVSSTALAAAGATII